MGIKTFFQKIIYPHRYNSEAYIQYLKKLGVKIGNNSYIYAPQKTHIDTTRPFMIRIGNNVSITQGVIILGHDYSYSVLNEVYKVMPNPCKLTVIGDNCFIGMNSIILSGAHIGNNCIIGAGAVVSGIVPDNTVWAGSPARQVSTLEEYYKKKINQYEEAAKLFVKEFKNEYDRYPKLSELGVYISLFLPRNMENKKYFDNIKSRMENVGDNLFNSEPLYNSYEDFISSLENK